jgi:hypothetical protein
LRHELQRTREAPAIATAVFDAHLCVAEYLLYGPTPYPEVMALGRELRETAQRAGALRAVAFAWALTGEAALLSGDLATADHDLREAADLHAEIGAAAGEAHSLQRLAELRVHQGDRAEARHLLQRALPLARWSPIANHLRLRIHGIMIVAADTPEEAHATVERPRRPSARRTTAPSARSWPRSRPRWPVPTWATSRARRATCGRRSAQPHSGRAPPGRPRCWRHGHSWPGPRATRRAAAGC